MLDDLMLLSGNNIPFLKAGITIHPPSIKEIAYITEKNFFIGCEMLNFSKDILLNSEDKTDLENLSNFEVLMTIINEKNTQIKEQRHCLLLVLSLIFPFYQISLLRDAIELKEELENGLEEKHYIDKNNFEDFKIILKKMFCLEKGDSAELNPKGDLAKKIAAKLKERQRKLAKNSNGNGKISILSRYVSILAVGQQKDMNSLLNYTIYQLFDEYQRYELKVQSDAHMSAMLAGAKDLKEVENWTKDIHS